MKLIITIIILLALTNLAYCNIFILNQDNSNKRLIKEISSKFKSNECKIITSQNLKNTLDSSKGKDILIVPNAKSFPADSMKSFDNFIRNKNSFVFISGPAFEELTYNNNGKYMPMEKIKNSISTKGLTKIVDFYNKTNECDIVSGSNSNIITTKPTKVNNEEAMEINIENQDGWFSLESYDLPKNKDINALVFNAKFSKPEKIWIRVQEENNSRWMAEISLSKQWKNYILIPNDFIFWNDEISKEMPKGRTTVDFNKAKKISITRHNFKLKDQTIEISNIYRMNNKIFQESASIPIMETISPTTKYYKTNINEIDLGNDKKTLKSPINIYASVFKNGGVGGKALNRWRFITIAKAMSNGKENGAAAHILLNKNDKDYAGSAWGYIGFDENFTNNNTEYVADMAHKMVNRIKDGVFIGNGGTQEFAYEISEPIKLSAFITNLNEKNFTGKLTFAVKKDNKIIKTFTKNTTSRNAHITADMNPLPEGEYTVDVKLSDNNKKLIDFVSHSFNVIKYKELTPNDVISQENGDFYYKGKKFYPNGVNYWPSYMSATQVREHYEITWLNPEVYDPEMIEKDLKAMAKLGYNVVSIQYWDTACARPTMDFAKRCAKYGIFIHLYMQGLHPLDQTHWGFYLPTLWEDFGKPMIKAAKIGNTPNIFSYDVGWEVVVGEYTKRTIYNQDWNKWITDQYGSAGNAIQDWKFTPEKKDGLIDCPSDDMLRYDGSYLNYVSAYRRFLDDKISKGYQKVKNNIRTLDKYHMIAARSGCGGTGNTFIVHWIPFDLASGGKHLDYTSPEAYNLTGRYEDFLKGGFNNLYGRFVTGNKPVFWPEYGFNLIQNAAISDDFSYKNGVTKEDIDGAVNFYDNFFKMLVKTNGSGSASWWWTGGYRNGEKSDFGIMTPDGYPREIAKIISKYNKNFASLVETTKPNYQIKIDRDKYVTGYAGIYDNFSGEYAKAVLEGKTPYLVTDATGSNSKTVSMTAIGNVPANGTNPHKYLNSEFNSINGNVFFDKNEITVNSDKLTIEVSLGNTGEPIWIAPKSDIDEGCVYLACDTNGTRYLFPILSDTPFLGDATAKVNIDKKSLGNDIKLRLTALNRTDFGETIRLNIIK